MDSECGQGTVRDAELPLDEKDVPGAALNGRDPATLMIPQLRRWLECRKAVTKGKKADLVARRVGRSNIESWRTVVAFVASMKPVT